jgi:hypothetical protein
MKAFIWRIVYALFCYWAFWLLFPAFLAFVGVSLPFLALLKICTQVLAVAYVLYPSQPPMPF